MGVARLVRRLTLVAFVLALALPGLWAAVGPPVERLEREGRAASPMPRLPRSPAEATRFPAHFEPWLNDRLGGREALLGLRKHILLDGLGESPSARVALGRDGWLFLADEPLPAGAHADAWRAALAARADWLAGAGVAYLVAVAPEKAAVYPEHCRRQRPCPSAAAAELVRAGLPGAARWVDLHATLRESAAQTIDQLYFPDDTHWNGPGGSAAAGAVACALGTTPPAVARAEREWTGDLARMIGRAEPVPRTDAPPEVRPLPVALPGPLPFALRHLVPGRLPGGDPSGPRVVLLHDSFGEALAPPLSERCADLVCLPTLALPWEAIGRLRPDAVVQLLVARQLLDPPPAQSPPTAPCPRRAGAAP